MKTMFLSLAFTALALVSCRKEDEKPAATTYPEEDFFPMFLINSELNQKVMSFINQSNGESGLFFKPMVKGKITALKVKIPGKDGALRVTLWDASAKTPIKSELVTVSEANVWITKDITDIDLQKDKEYVITFNTRSWYSHSKLDNSFAAYPFVIGNITITGFKWIPGAELAFPTSTASDYAGDLSFNFQRTE